MASRRRLRHLAVLACLLAAGCSVVHAGSRRRSKDVESLDPAVNGVLARLDAAQQDLATLRADIVETRTLALLSEPEVLSGTLSFQRPGQIRWEYAKPERRIYLLADGKLTGWLPEKNRVERVDLGRHERRIRRLVTLGQDARALTREFEITGVYAGEGDTTPEHLLLVPRSRRVRKRMQELHLWIDDELGLPRRIRWLTGSGDTVDLVLSNITVNPELSAKTFELEIPPGAQIVEGSSSLGLSSQDSSKKGS